MNENIIALFRIPGPIAGRPPHEPSCSCKHCYIYGQKRLGVSEADASIKWLLMINGLV